MITNFKNFLLESNDLSNFLKQNSNNYITKLDKDIYQNILNEYCTEYNKNNVIFYRGDENLSDNYYLINGKETRTRLSFNFNYIITEFMSSDLWKEKKYPLKKHSLNMTLDTSISRFFSNSNTYYSVIPFDSAKIISLPKLFGNYSTELFKIELSTKFNDPSKLAEYLQNISESWDITLDNVNDIIKKLENIFNNPKDTKDSQFNLILNNMKKHNMSFTEYMKFIFSPENYDILNYKDMTKSSISKYTAGYTDSYVLLNKIR